MAENNFAVFSEIKKTETPKTNHVRRRKREEIIHELGLNYIERLILLNGHSMRRFNSFEFGYDAAISTFNRDGELENGTIFFQLKATERLRVLKNGKISLTVKMHHFYLWFYEPAPVYMIVYDAPSNRAFWLDLKKYYAGIAPEKMQRNYKVLHISPDNILSPETIEEFRAYKNDLIWRIENN